MDRSKINAYAKSNPCVEIRDEGNNETGRVRTTVARLMFAKFPDQETGRYTCSLVFPLGTDVSALTTIARRKAREVFGDAAQAATKETWPVKPQDKKVETYGEADFAAGAFMIDAKTKFAPPVLDRDGKTRLPLTDSELVYSGMWVTATVDAYSYDAKGKRGVSFGLLSLMKVADDEKLSGSSVVDGYQPLDLGGSSPAAKANGANSPDASW